jgi:signal transduction histidine kinase/ligand-binding sensor domain-containing protein
LRHSSWTERDGAPHGIRALAQTSDGYLWLGTTAGLFRFDGLRFTMFIPPADSPQFSSLDISCLTADGQDGLWIGFRVGGIAYLKDGRLTNYGDRNGLPSAQVDQILARSDGEVWSVTGGEFMKLTGTAWQDAVAGQGPDSHQVKRAYIDRSGDLWLNAATRIYVRRIGQPAFSDTGDTVRQIMQFAEAPDGSVWTADGWTSLRPISGFQEPQWITRLKGAATFLFDTRGWLWIAHDYYGLDLAGQQNWTHGPNTTPLDHFDATDGLTSNECGGMLEDREGNIWVGTALGLDRFEQARFRQFDDAALRSFPGVAAGIGGVVWIGDWGKPLLLHRGDKTTEFGPKRGWGPVYADRNGAVWDYDYWGSKLWRLRDGEFEQIPFPPEWEHVVAQSITGDGGDGIHVAFEGHGIWHWQNSQWTRVADTVAPSKTPSTIYFDSMGRLWAGYADGRIAGFQRGSARVFQVGANGNFGSVMTIYQDGDRIWAGGTNGVAIFTGDGFRPLLPVEGAEPRGVSGIVSSQDRDLWLNGARGVIRVPAAEVERALVTPTYRFQAETFDFRDGVSGGAAQLRPTPSAIADSTGRLWFATDSNLVSVDPSDFGRQQAAPQITIESLRTDGKERRPRGADRIVVQSRNLEIDYVGISLASPQRVTYRYMLEGEDNGWQEAGARRQAFYSSLGPGSYRFRVAASIGRGQWNQYTLPSDIVVLPAFYQTKWFLAMCGIAVIVALAVSHRLRIQHVTSRIRDRLEERAAERVRIARDLHDTLLQGLHGLMLRFHFAAKQIPEHEPARAAMEEALEAADRVIEEARDQVRTLRSELSGRDLSKALAEVGSEMNWEQRVQFTVTTEGSYDVVSPAVVSELYFIGREAIANAFRHANASQIRVEFSSDGKKIQLRCHDDGGGIDPGFEKKGCRRHWGFIGMRERAQKIGARFECWSRPGRGTEITVTVPTVLRHTPK